MFGEKIRELMELRGMTPDELHKKSGVSRTVLFELMRNKRDNTTTETLGRLATALGITPDYFMSKDTFGPAYILDHLENEEDIKFVTDKNSAMWIEVTRELKEEGLTVEDIKALLNIVRRKG